jgi:hypothetical protein
MRPSALTLTAGRHEVRELSGGSEGVPMLVLDDGDAVTGTDEIVAWAKASPAA